MQPAGAAALVVLRPYTCLVHMYINVYLVQIFVYSGTVLVFLIPPYLSCVGALAMEALHKQVLPFMLRRMKDDVLDDLPPKIIQDYYCDLSPLQVGPTSPSRSGVGVVWTFEASHPYSIVY